MNEEKNKIKKLETSKEWISALMPTLALAKDYEPGRMNDGRTSIDDLSLDKEPETVEKVRFSDCDPFGHLNNARYFDYFVNARDEHLHRFYKVDLALHSLKHDEGWVVQEHRIAYLKAVRLKEEIRIRSRLLSFTDNETFVESLMLSQNGRSLKAFLWSRYRYIRIKSGRSAQHPDYIMDILRATKFNSESHLISNFDLRVKEVIDELRIRALRSKN